MRIHEVILPPLASSNNKKITNNKEKTNQNLIMNRQIPCSYKSMEGYAIGVYKPPHQLHIAVAFQHFNDPKTTYSITVPRGSDLYFRVCESFGKGTHLQLSPDCTSAP